MIKVTNLSKAFGDQVLFRELSFTVGRRERIGLVGRNGHGKTTLFSIILGRTTPDSGEVTIPKRYHIGHLEQHLRFTEPTIIEETCLGLPADQADQSWRAEKILMGLGFTEADMARPPAEFSGGYQVRLNLAKLLVSGPDLLLLDEPTNYLDVVSIRWLSRFLRSWPGELILITHDRSFMDSVTTHTVGIHRQRARKIEGGTEKLYQQILMEEEVYEKTRVNDEKRRKEVERFIERFRAKNSLATRVQSRIKMLEKNQRMDRLQEVESLDFRFNAAPFSGKIMLRAEDLSFAYDGGPTLFSGLDLEVMRRDRICVIGQNGKGKSTLLRLLAGELTPRHGTITPHPRLKTGYFAQTNLNTLNPHNDVVSEILSASADCLPQTARNIAGNLMFEGDHALKKISILSGGEKSRVMLGKLLVSPSHLLLLDEPTNHLDMDSCDSLLAAIDDYEGAVLIVTHNEAFLHTLATRFIVFDRGRVRLYNRSYQDFLDEVGWEMDDTLRAKPKRSTDNDAATEPGVATKADGATDKKALRQARARIAQEKSRMLGPLEKKVHELESRIETLEKDHAACHDDLAAASAAGDGERIAELSRRDAEIQQEINDLFEQLDDATKKRDEQSAIFETKLGELE